MKAYQILAYYIAFAFLKFRRQFQLKTFTLG